MNYDKIPKKFKELLDSTTHGLKPSVTESLRTFRTRALDHQRTRRSPVVNWVYAHTGLPVFSPVTRPVSMLLASVFLAVTLLTSFHYVQSYISERDITDVDLAILTDDMPLHVYVD